MTTPAAPTSALAARIGRRLAARRGELGLSRRELARQNDVSNITLRELELGLANPTLGRLEAAAAMYRMTPEELLEDVDAGDAADA